MEQFSFPFQQSFKNQLTESVQHLIINAEAAANEAYAPYSKFKVGAAVLLENGQIITGSNHENASFPAGICAERTALGQLKLNDKTNPVKAIAITYQGTGKEDHPLPPCGICRQSILEVQLWQEKPIAVYMSSPAGNIIFVEDASCLLPFYFGSNDLSSVTPPVNSPF